MLSATELLLDSASGSSLSGSFKVHPKVRAIRGEGERESDRWYSREKMGLDNGEPVGAPEFPNQLIELM